MKSSSSTLTPSQAALSAIKAGADIVMLSWSMPEQKKSFEVIKKAVLKGEIPESKINEKVLRVLSLKKYLFSNLSFLATNNNKIPSNNLRLPSSVVQATRGFSKPLQEIESNIVKSKFNIIFANGLLISDKSICVASNSSQLFKSINSKSITQIKGFSFPIDSAPQQIENLFKKIDCEVYFMTVESLQQVKVLNSINDIHRKKVVVFNYTLPSALKNRNKFFNVIDLYGFSSNHVGLLSDRIKEFSLIRSNRSKNKFSQNKKPTNSSGF